MRHLGGTDIIGTQGKKLRHLGGTAAIGTQGKKFRHLGGTAVMESEVRKAIGVIRLKCREPAKVVIDHQGATGR